MRKPVDSQDSGQARITSNDARKFMLAMQDGFTSELTTAASYIFPETGLK